MFDFKEMIKQIGAAGAVGFGAAITAALLGDAGGALAAAHGGVGAAVGVGLGLLGNLIKQLIDRARGLFHGGYEEAEGLLAEAQSKIAAARKFLG